MTLIPLPPYFDGVHPPLTKGEAEGVQANEERDYTYHNGETQPAESKYYIYHNEDLLNYRSLTWKGGHIPYSKKLKQRARKMRNNMTKAEQILRDNYLKWLKIPVHRQKPLDHYIADFYIPSAKLVIEVDGESHSSEEATIYDTQRTRLLNSYGLIVIRFTNEQIYNGRREVSELISSYLKTPCD